MKSKLERGRKALGLDNFLKGWWQQQLCGGNRIHGVFLISLPSTISFTPPLFVLLCLHRGPLDTTNAPSTQCFGGGGGSIRSIVFWLFYWPSKGWWRQVPDISLLRASTHRAEQSSQRSVHSFSFTRNVCWWAANQRRPKCHQQLISRSCSLLQLTAENSLSYCRRL
jgi:hypothetical protein